MRYRIAITTLILITSVLLILFGLTNDGYRQTQGKGSVICWECIGLGQD